MNKKPNLKSYFAVIEKNNTIWNLWIGNMVGKIVYADEARFPGIPYRVGETLNTMDCSIQIITIADNYETETMKYVTNYVADLNIAQLHCTFPRVNNRWDT
jgi:hypothetical protein